MVYLLGFYIPLTDLLVVLAAFSTLLLVAVLMELRKLRLTQQRMAELEGQMKQIEKKLESEERSLSKMLDKVKKMLK
jgi:membrane protein insertase Oxa1/YidC/SpoIIIJ